MSQDRELHHRIRRNLRHARSSREITPAQLYTRLEDHYGTYAYSSYRNLEATYPSNTTYFNRVLVDALAAALDCPRTELASDADYAALKAYPHRKAQRPDNLPQQPNDLDTVLYVHDPETVVLRIEAFRKQRGYQDKRSFHRALKIHGDYKIAYPTFVGIMNNPVRLRHDMITAIAKLFSRPPAQPFDRNRLLFCLDNCPHCHKWLIGA